MNAERGRGSGTGPATGSGPGSAAGAAASRPTPRAGSPGAPPHERPRFPGADERWRCAGCGNLTRFDVLHTSRVREYWHFDLSGEGAVEESTLLGRTVESVSCRWCGRADAIEHVPRAGPRAGPGES